MNDGRVSSGQDQSKEGGVSAEAPKAGVPGITDLWRGIRLYRDAQTEEQGDEAIDLINAALDAKRASQATTAEAGTVVVGTGWLTNGAELHPMTANLVVRFARALAAKLAAAEVKYGYSDGWRSDDWLDECRGKLQEHVAKGDPRDVAAYCAFLWHHGASTVGQGNWGAAEAGGEARAALAELVACKEIRLHYHRLDFDEAVAFLKREKVAWESACAALATPVLPSEPKEQP